MNDDIQIIVAQKHHRQQLLHLLLESFIIREPFAVAIGVGKSDNGPNLIALVDDVLQESHSFVAVIKTTTEEDINYDHQEKVIGCRISKLLDKSDAEKTDHEFYRVIGNSKSMHIFASIFNRLMLDWTKELTKINPNWQRILEFEVMCVDEGNSNRGIAKRLVERSLRLAEELHVDFITCIATNIFSQKVFEKLGYVTLRSIDYIELKDDQNKPYVTSLEDNRSIKWMIKDMRNER